MERLRAIPLLRPGIDCEITISTFYVSHSQWAQPTQILNQFESLHAPSAFSVSRHISTFIGPFRYISFGPSRTRNCLPLFSLSKLEFFLIPPHCKEVPRH